MSVPSWCISKRGQITSVVGDFNFDQVKDVLVGNALGEVLLLGLLPGDFDGDGDVDGADFLAWQQGEVSNPLSQSDLDDWQANFGAVASPIIAASTGVPEPSTGIMLMLGMVATLSATLGRFRAQTE